MRSALRISTLNKVGSIRTAAPPLARPQAQSSPPILNLGTSAGKASSVIATTEASSPALEPIHLKKPVLPRRTIVRYS